MPTLTTKGTETKSRILRIAADLFCKNGVHATSPDDIIEAAGIGKGQFYHYFKSKAGLIHEVLLWYVQELRSSGSPLETPIRSWSDVEGWFQAHIDLQRSFHMTRACIFGTAANEITDADDAMATDLQMIFDGMRDRLATFLGSNALADFCIATVQGAMLLGKVRRSSDPAESVIRQALAHLRRTVAS
jgi:AcrR family transcriptional regulator